MIGPDACGSGRRLDVEVFVSPGGYILGEETALLECMEGHRGEPRNKPPFPGNYGLHGRPTLINSVETLADVPVIVQRGAQWWSDQGAGDSVGWKFFAVSGHVERPDVYCVPMGTTVRELIELAGGVSGGRKVGAVQPGGASSNFIGPDKLDMPLDFGAAAENGTMLGSGALVVLAEGTDLLAASTNVLRFFRNESCGKCVPCRLGSTKAHAILRDVVESGSELDDDRRAHLVRLEEAMRKTSICGLGQVALGPVMSVLGLNKGGAAARPQPRPGGADGPAGPVNERAGEPSGTASASSSPRGRSARRWPGSARPGGPPSRTSGWPRRCTGCRPPTCARRRRCRGSPARRWTGTRSAPPTPTAPPRACPPTSTWPGRCGWAPRPRPSCRTASAWRSRPARCCRTGRTRW